MRYSRIFMAMALLTGAIGCSVQEENVDTADEPFQIVFEAAPFLDGDAGEDTKTYVTPNGNYSAYEFFWSAQDTVGIFPSEGKQMAFSMAGGAGASSATFDGGAWTCKVGYTYRSYFPLVGKFYLDPTRIPVSFTGQKQVGNANSDHFQKYDYMYAPATTKEGSLLNFSYKHLIAAVLPWVELPAGHYTKLTLSLDEPLFVTKGEYDLTAATPAIVGTQFSNTLSIDLDVTFANAETLIAYVPIAPMNMTGKTLTITVTRDNGIPYQYTYVPGKPYAASNIYRLRAPSSMVNYSAENITFADSKVKEKLVAAFDANSDGEISYEEAAAVTSSADLKAAFGAIKTYKTFDEFQYFTGITEIPASMFMGWRLTSIVLPENVSIIYNTAFCDCTSLSSISIPSGVKSIGYTAFGGCTSLTSVIIPTSVSSIEDNAFQACTSLISITIPEGVTSIESNTFSNCTSLTSITIPSSVRSIGYGSFSGCTSLVSIIFSEGVSSIGNKAFFGCTSLSAVTIPETVTSIGESAFYNCTSLSSVSIPSVSSIGRYAFEGCTGLTSITILGVTSIGESAFYGCTGLTFVTIPSVTSIGHNAFRDCTGLTSITIPESVTSIGDGAFSGCTGLTSITIPESVPSIGNYAFSGCTGLTSITIPESITRIGDYAFSGCTGLTSITIPESVMSIGDWAFRDCTSLSSLIVLATSPPIVDYGLFTDICFIYVPSASLHDYKTDQNWSSYVQIIQAIGAPIFDIPLAVDLGLSVKWSSWNLGVNSPEKYGDYYAWGEIEPYYSDLSHMTWKEGKSDGYTYASYKWYDTDILFTKYNTDGLKGIVDNKTVLDPDDDAAHVTLGGSWRMPTDAEWTELRTQCTWTWTSLYGVNGFNVTGPNGNSIFLPAAGVFEYYNEDYSSIYRHLIGQEGYYWSSSLCLDNPLCAWSVHIYCLNDVGNYDRCGPWRAGGRCIRPVSE